MSSPLSEEWRPVVGYEKYYEVSNFGGVKSRDRVVETKAGWTMNRRAKLLSPNIHHRSGHLSVQLTGDAGLKRVWVHRLVLEAFVGPCPEGSHALHFDDNPKNNSLENLSWGTSSQNAHDRVRNGRNANYNKENCVNGHRLESPNLQQAKLRKGCRGCLACHRAGAYVRYHPELKGDFRRVADSYYLAIMEKG